MRNMDSPSATYNRVALMIYWKELAEKAEKLISTVDIEHTDVEYDEIIKRHINLTLKVVELTKKIEEIENIIEKYSTELSLLNGQKRDIEMEVNVLRNESVKFDNSMITTATRKSFFIHRR